jgi:hypothetical protein
MKYAVIAVSLLVLTACASTKDPIVTNPVVQQKSKLVLPTPRSVKQQNVEWIVITRENVDKKLAELEAKGGKVTLFAVTPDGYEKLSLNSAELRRYIEQQNAVIRAMREYYEN